MKKHSFKFIALSFLLALCFSLSFTNQSRADACLPTCDPHDTRMLTFGGQGFQTFVFDLLTFGIGTPPDSNQLHIRIFDGDVGGMWDNRNFGAMEYLLFADPEGDATGTFLIGTWTSDGSGGENNGVPMPDNDFFDIIIPNAPEAQAISGNYLYRMAARNVDTGLMVIMSFKVQVVGPNTSLFIFPGDQPFGYEATTRGATADDRAATGAILYPTFTEDPFGCIGFFDDLCLDDPACCYFSPYNGDFDFFFFNENEGRIFIDFWDGDLDYGIKPLGDPPPYEDTDDPNTPPGIPEFADVLNTNPQASAATSPPDDLNPLFTGSAFLRYPNITYSLIDPNGVEYHNDNPSATNEWELFRLSTEAGCAPNICDYEVEEIPVGIWHVSVKGMDLWNINYIRAFDKMVGVDTNGEPVVPLDPIEPLNPPDPPVVRNVPTFSELGMLGVAFMLGAIGIYSLRRKRNIDSSSC